MTPLYSWVYIENGLATVVWSFSEAVIGDSGPERPWVTDLAVQDDLSDDDLWWLAEHDAARKGER
jgi:hypothetical protein